VAGDGPDVVQSWPPSIWELSAQAQVQNLNEYVRDLKKAEIELLIPSRKSALDYWVKAVRQKFPVLEKANLKVVTDALTTMSYLTPTETFLCQTEAGKVITPALNQVMRDGTARPLLFRDLKPQIESAASSCGATFK
jgi:hypothetical protein